MNYHRGFSIVLSVLLLTAPFLSEAQAGRADDSLRVMADTMHFATPFAFSITGTAPVSGAKLFTRCVNWAQGISDSLKGADPRVNLKTRRITMANVPATADISCTVTIFVKKNNYTCSLTNYLFHPINGGSLPVDKAAAIKSNQPTVNIEKLLISRNYQHIFQSLDSYIKKPA